MPFERSTLPELRSAAESEVATRTGLGTLLPRSVAIALARVAAGFAHHCLGFVAFAIDQVLPDRADGTNLERHASLRNVTRKPATPATGSVTFVGSESIVVPAGTELQRADGELYTTDADATVTGGTATAGVTASAAGISGNDVAGQVLSLTSPIGGIDSTATVAVGGITGGLDRESDEDLRARVLAVWRNPPQGGALQDYELAALEVAGVTRAWALRWHFGAGTVGVTFLLDNDPTSIVPDAADVALVQAAIDLMAAATANAIVFAPGTVPLNPLISLTPDTGSIRAAVEDELEGMLRREAAPGVTIPLSKIVEAISHAVGEESHVLNWPREDVTAAAGEIVVLGSIVWGVGAQPSPTLVEVEVLDPTIVIA